MVEFRRNSYRDNCDKAREQPVTSNMKVMQSDIDIVNELKTLSK